jgi:NDP-sugar pyrophosphorylase family protein
MRFKTAVVIAGGEGSRMRPLTKYVPKPLVEVGGLPLILHVIYFLRSNGIDNVYVTYGYKGGMVLDCIKNEVEGFINTNGKDNSYFLYNSLIKYIDEPIVVCPCDMVTNLDLSHVYNEYQSFERPAGCLVPVQTTLDADTIICESNVITSISRDYRAGLYASGIQILNPSAINQLTKPENNFYQVWANLIELKQLYVTNTMPTQWKIYDTLKDLS